MPTLEEVQDARLNTILYYRYLPVDDRLRNRKLGNIGEWLQKDKMVDLILQEWPVCIDFVGFLVSKGAVLPQPRLVSFGAIDRATGERDPELARRALERVLSLTSRGGEGEDEKRLRDAVEDFAKKCLEMSPYDVVGTFGQVIERHPEPWMRGAPGSKRQRVSSSSGQEEPDATGYVQMFYDTLFKTGDHVPLFNRIRSGDPVPEWIVGKTMLLYRDLVPFHEGGRRRMHFLRPRVGALIFAMKVGTGDYEGMMHFVVDSVHIRKALPSGAEEFDMWIQDIHRWHLEESIRAREQAFNA